MQSKPGAAQHSACKQPTRTALLYGPPTILNIATQAIYITAFRSKCGAVYRWLKATPAPLLTQLPACDWA